MTPDSEPISPARRQHIIELISKHGRYDGTCQGFRIQITEITNPRHCIAWKLHAGGRWHAGYTDTVEEARVRINKLITEFLTKRVGKPVQSQLFEE